MVDEVRSYKSRTFWSNKGSDMHYLKVPADLARDENYPFKSDSKIKVTADGKRIIFYNEEDEKDLLDEITNSGIAPSVSDVCCSTALLFLLFGFYGLFVFTYNSLILDTKRFYLFDFIINDRLPRLPCLIHAARSIRVFNLIQWFAVDFPCL